MVRIAINGFGRIGRMVFRAGFKNPELEFVAINDLTDTKTLSHLLKYDSVHKRLDADISYTENSITVNGNTMKVYAQKDPAKLPWNELNIDIVIESTGRFRTKESASLHILAGAKKVLISAPAKDGIKTIVKGVNEHTLTSQDTIVSNASCTTNCLAPIVKVLDDNFGIEQGFMTTVHAYTADQRLQDAPHADLRRSRSAAINIVPTTTGAAKAVANVIPHLKGKLDGLAIRVPVVDASITDFVCKLKKDVTAEQINSLFESVAQRELKDVIEYTKEPLVSSDIIGNTHSCVFDSSLTKIMPNGFVKILAWYDNEIGYSNRMVDALLLLAKVQ